MMGAGGLRRHRAHYDGIVMKKTTVVIYISHIWVNIEAWVDLNTKAYALQKSHEIAIYHSYNGKKVFGSPSKILVPGM